MADNQACVYATMLLHDAGVAITADKINAVVSAAGIELRATVPILFANFIAKKSVSTLIAAAASSGAAAAPAAGAAAPAAAAGAKKEEPKAAGKKKATPPPSDEDDDMIGGLF